MAYELFDQGEVALLREYFTRKNVQLGIITEDGPDLQDNDTIADLTEPSGSNYERQTVEPADVTVAQDGDNDGLLTIDALKTFKVGNSSENIYSAFLYNSNDDELIVATDIDTSERPNDYIDLSLVDSLRLSGDTLTFD